MRRALASLHPPPAAAADTVRTARADFRTHAQRLRYPAFRARQFPIGSGAIERTAKTLMHLRQVQAGMRWRVAGAQQVASLRALHRSGRWDTFWQTQPQHRLLQPRKSWTRTAPTTPATQPDADPVAAAALAHQSLPSPADDLPTAPPARIQTTGKPWAKGKHHWRRGLPRTASLAPTTVSRCALRPGRRCVVLGRMVYLGSFNDLCSTRSTDMPDLATLFPAMPLVHAGTGVSDINHIINIILVLLIAIDIHELGHAVVADKLGDDTPRLAGHLSLNPFRHMDQFGILLLFLSAISGRGFTYGFTPINERKLRQRTEFGPAIVSVAGPLMNLILAAVVAIPLIHAGQMDTSFGFPLTAVGNNVQVSDFLSQLVYVNCFLAVFNLIPIPPLDGWAIVSSLLPPKVRFDLRPLVQYGPFILLLLIIFEPQVHFFSSVVDPMTSWVLEKLGGA